MDEESRELCFKEISNDVIDSDKMVTISTLSENWSMSMMESSEALEKWIKSCGKGKDFVTNFLVRGTQKDGMPFMTITPEDKLASLKAKSDKVFQMLYSLKLGTEPPAIINPTLLDAKKKRIQLTNMGSCRESQHTAPEVDVKPNTSTKQESSRPSPFMGTSSKDAKAPKSQANKFFKAEPKTPAKETSAASTSPKKKTPLKKEPPKKNGSIGSFFSSKPQVKKEKSKSPSSDKENKTESSEEIAVSKNNSQNTNTESSNGKRSSLSNDLSDEEKNAPEDHDNPPKRRKVDSEKKKARAKGSRIMLMDDSDDENEDIKEPDNDVEMEEPEPEPEPEPTKPETKQTKKSTEPNEPGRKRRVKKRRIVTKTYEDEDGFIKTVKETEIYSSDVDDCEVIEEKSNKVEVKSPNSDTKAKESKSKSSKTAAKSATKQGSIMNFFSKK